MNARRIIHMLDVRFKHQVACGQLHRIKMFQLFKEYCDVSGFLAISCCLVLLFYIASFVQKARKLPPGPVGFPVVGYLPFFTSLRYSKLMTLGSTYGDIFSMRLGSTLLVVLNNGKAIREALSKPEFLGRPPDNLFTFLIKDFESPFFSNGRAWQEQRRFAIHTMRDLGFGKSWMEKHILDEIQDFLKGITESDGMPINIAEHLTPSMSNNICSLVFGHRYKHDDPRRIFLDRVLKTVTRSINHLTPHIFFPWLTKMPFGRKIFKIDHISKLLQDLMIFIRDRIDEHEKTLDPNNIRDYIDGYLTVMKTCVQNDVQTVFSRNMLTGSIINLFVAGSESVRATVDWCLYTMAVFQDVQKKVQAEIDGIIGKERMPSWQDQMKMSFTQAVLAEIQRWRTVASFSLPRYTVKNAELLGYHIPKGTFVIVNLWSAHHDPEQWEQPDEFIPDRFLSKDGKSMIKPGNYIPFSTGKRSCPGETLALIEVFLYFTSVLQKFTVDIPERTPVDFEGTLGFTYHPKPHMLCFKRRP